MSKTITINCENEQVAEAVKASFIYFKDSMSSFLIATLKQQGIESDPSIVVKDDVVEISMTSKDKGTVLAKSGDTIGPVQHKNIKSGDAYLSVEQGLVWLYLRAEDGGADKKVGHFKTLSDAIDQFEGEEVLAAIEKINSGGSDDSDVVEAEVVD